MSHSDDVTASSIIKDADITRYEAKNVGRNSYRIMDSDRKI